LMTNHSSQHHVNQRPQDWGRLQRNRLDSARPTGTLQ
jgi:hypothetical protein